MNYWLIFILVLTYSCCLYHKYNEETTDLKKDKETLKKQLAEANKRYENLYNEKKQYTSYTYDNDNSIYSNNQLLYNNSTNRSYTEQEIHEMV